MGTTLDLYFKATVSAFISATASGEARELAAFGTRGDGKTWGAFGAMIAHAQRHHAAGFALPAKWLGVADTFQSHKTKTHESLTAPGWHGIWRLRADGHLAECVVNGTVLVQLRLFGVEDQAGMDRLRAESHGLWFEEPAPASVLVQSTGLSETAWGLGMTSQRLPSHAHPAIMTLNYPDEDHWTWQRFVVQKQPGSRYFRIPPGELASQEQRAEWFQALANRPDMMRRLLEGQPGTLMLGSQVAHGFNADAHVSPARLAPVPGVPLWLGQDGGHTPATVIGQRVQGRCRILASLTNPHFGIEQQVRDLVWPWLGEHAPWWRDSSSMLHVEYDPALNTDDYSTVERNALRTLRKMLPGVYHAGPVTWTGRKNPMLALLNSMTSGSPTLQIDASCTALIKALNGAWYYATGPDGRLVRADGRRDEAQPKKPNEPHADLGDAFCYLVAGMAPTAPERSSTPPKVERHWDLFHAHRPANMQPPSQRWGRR